MNAIEYKETSNSFYLQIMLNFPQLISNLLPSFDDKERQHERQNSVMNSEGEEELETLLHNLCGIDRDVEDSDEQEIIYKQPSSRVQQRPCEVIVAEEDKRSDIEFEISKEEINLDKLRRIASTGVPPGGSVRATVWKLLLGYLPPSRDLWEKELTENRQKYAKLKEELLCSPVSASCQELLKQSELTMRQNEPLSSSEQNADENFDGVLRRYEISQEDHPLSLGKSSVWCQYFQHIEVAEQINRDVQRTHPDLKFFSANTSFGRRNQEAMRNILLVFAKLNPAIQYVQGMNEVLAPMFYVFSTDSNQQNAANAEADSFSCFVRLLGDSLDHFCQQLDYSSAGILSTLSRLSELLKANDEELWQHLEVTNKVKPQYYAFRWITLLLTQEFSFQTVLRIWDSLLSSPSGVKDMLLRICCAMLLCTKSRLMLGDFMDNMKLLQHYPDSNVENILQVAQDLSEDTLPYSSYQ